MFKKTSISIALTIGFGPLWVAGAAYAQQPASQRIEITGSNIKRIDLETSSPVQVINREDIRNSGAGSVRELLEILPSSSVGSLSDINGSNSFASGASSADLRNLGKSSTLILFNGRRVSPYALADFNELFTNLDSLPLDAVERVEILRSGASAVYGSDAVAGVINIITRKNYSGVQVAASHERSQVSKRFRQSTASVTAGFGDLERDRYNVLANVEVFTREKVMWREVMDHINPLRLSSGAVPATFNAQLSTYSYPGNLIPGGPIARATAKCPTNLIVANLCRYDRFERFQALPAADRVNALLSGRLMLGSGLEAYAEALVSKTETTYLSPFTPYGDDDAGGVTPFTVWGNPVTNAGQVFYARRLPVGHPLNPTAAEAGWRYRFTDAPSENTASSDSYRFLTGLKGGWRNYDWDVSLGFLGSKVTDASRGRFSKSGFVALIGDYEQDVLPSDFFNKPGGYRIGEQNTAAVVDRLFPTYGSEGKTTQAVLDGKLTGELGQMAGGPIGFAAGFDLRREKFTITPSQNLLQGDIVGVGLSSTSGARSFGAAYGEVLLPLAKSLEVQLAARVDKYPNLTANVSPKVGVMWRANEAVMLRGTAETGFRAPNLTETAPSVKFAFNNGTLDPKRCDPALNLAADLRAQAALLPNSDPNKALLDARADKVEGDECQAGVAAIAGNNPELKPEKSQSFTLGMALQPARNLGVTIDYWQIRRKQEIDIKTADELLSVEDAGLPPGSSIRRRTLNSNDPTFTTAEQAQYGVTAGALDSITRSFENLFQTKTSGVDIGFDWNQQTPIGRLRVGGLGTYLIDYKEFIGAENRFGDNLAGRYGYPRFNATVDVNLASGAWINGLKVRQSSGYDLRRDRNDTEGDAAWCAARPWAQPCEVLDSTFVDYYLRWSGVKGLTLGFYVKNVFNKFIPIDFRAQPRGSVIPDEPDDAKRRTFKLTAEYKF